MGSNPATAKTRRARSSGSVVAWGSSSYGGDAPISVTTENSGVVAVYSNTYAFAAVKIDGSVVAWGGCKSGFLVADSRRPLSGTR